MKRIITLLATVLVAQISISQAVFESDLSSWAAGDPTDFFGPFGGVNSLSSDSVIEISIGATYGTSFANIKNASSSHKRITTQPFFVVPGETYVIKMYVAGNVGDVRFRAYNATASAYPSALYTPYQSITIASPAFITDSVVAPAGCFSMAYIISIRNTDGLGLAMDSVAITGMVGTPPPPPSFSSKSIYEIQYTTSSSGDSPLEDSLVEVTGIVTGTSTVGNPKGYFIQDSALAWNGIFVEDATNLPSRGDKVTVKGRVKEQFDNTQIMAVDTMITVSTGNSEPSPVVVTSSTAADEMYEGVLLTVSAAMCVDTVQSFGEWFVAGPGLDTIMIDDLLLSTTYNPVLYQGYDVTGVLFYSFSNFKIEPRDSTDLAQNITVSIKEINKDLNISVYPNPTNGFLTLSGTDIGNAEIFALDGKLVKSFSLNYINTIDVSALENGTYLMRVTSAKKTGITRFVKQ